MIGSLFVPLAALFVAPNQAAERCFGVAGAGRAPPGFTPRQTFAA